LTKTSMLRVSYLVVTSFVHAFIAYRYGDGGGERWSNLTKTCLEVSMRSKAGAWAGQAMPLKLVVDARTF